MKRHLLMTAAAIGVWTAAASCQAAWIFRPSTYSHDPMTCERVVQYARPELSYAPVDPTYQQSAYRHNRSSIRVRDSYDYFHVVETWGEAVRPYGEWERPYRAGATPYGPWGNPQGPWTTPFGAWVNPYGLGRLPAYAIPYYPYGAPHGGFMPPPPAPLAAP